MHICINSNVGKGQSKKIQIKRGEVRQMSSILHTPQSALLSAPLTAISG